MAIIQIADTFSGCKDMRNQIAGMTTFLLTSGGAENDN